MDNNPDITFDKIRAWINDPNDEGLSESEKRIYARWDYAYDQLKIEKPSAVVNRLCKKFGISHTLAYWDIRQAQRLFNPVIRRETDWIRDVIIEDALLQMQVAKEMLDSKAWREARQDLIKIYAIDKANVDGIDPKNLGKNNYYILVNIDNNVKKLDFNKLNELPVDKRISLTDEFLYKELDSEQEAKDIMNS